METNGFQRVSNERKLKGRLNGRLLLWPRVLEICFFDKKEFFLTTFDKFPSIYSTFDRNW